MIKTMWYIHDGNEGVVQKQGASIIVNVKDEAKGYPVIVEMYHKGLSIPNAGYKSIDILANELEPKISCEDAREVSKQECVEKDI